jgi:hypothetical protein
MSFTGLHRALGASPGALTSEMVDQAVALGVAEADDLDWKDVLPPEKNLNQTDFPKDVAAMANAGGGLLVYGIGETQKVATKRLDVGSLTETHERALRSAAVTAISPPVFGLDILELGPEGSRVVAVVVPASVDVPHLIYRGEYFGAPIRNNADTVWMRERQVDALYRARFTEQRSSREALTTLHTNAAAGRDISDRVWFVGVARPRIPAALPPRLRRDEARYLLDATGPLALAFVGRGSIHPLENVSSSPRPGLRSWVFGNRAEGDMRKWREAWISLYDDGSVTVAAAVGGHRRSNGETSAGNQVSVDALEAALADLLALVRTTSEHTSGGDHDIRIALEWDGDDLIEFEIPGGWDSDVSALLAAYTPIQATISTASTPDEYYDATYDLICDAVNQAGVEEPRMMAKRSAT